MHMINFYFKQLSGQNWYFLKGNKKFAYNLFGAFLLAFVFSTTAMAQMQEIFTDKQDYYPGDTVIITGIDWIPGETVELIIDNISTPDSDTLFAVADAAG